MEKKLSQIFLKRWGLFDWLVFGFFILSLSLILVEPLKSQFTQGLSAEKNQILSVVENRFSRDSPIRKVIKLLSPQGITVEVYGKPDEQGQPVLIESLSIQDRHDAYFNLNGRATNLALRDMNNDGTAEIIVPTYDDDWNPRLNVFTYDEDINGFRALNE